MQIAGSGFRIEAEKLKIEFERNGELRRHLQKYIQGFMVQTSQTAACNRLHNIEERLARWLLSCRDRMSSDRLCLTQDFLGQMLGSPRTTVTARGWASGARRHDRSFARRGDGSRSNSVGERVLRVLSHGARRIHAASVCFKSDIRQTILPHVPYRLTLIATLSGGVP